MRPLDVTQPDAKDKGFLNIDMKLKPTERTAIFIDGPNTHASAKQLGFDIDYRKLRDLIDHDADLLRAKFYTSLPENKEEYSPLRPLVDWLDYNGFQVVTKTQKEFQDASGRTRYKGDLDVDVAVDMLRLAPRLDHAVLLSGDGDLAPALQALHHDGVRTTVVSTIRTNQPMIADELRRGADEFCDLVDVRDRIRRTGQASR